MFSRDLITPFAKLLEPAPQYWGDRGGHLKMDLLRKLSLLQAENVKRARDRKQKLQEMAEEKEKEKELKDGMDRPTSKQQWKEQLGLKSCKCRREVEEEFQEVDNDNKDPDYQPEKDPEQDFIVGDAEINEEDTFEIKKHVHVINLQEAGDYIIEIRRFVTFFSKVVRKAKVDVAKEYRTLIHFMKEMVLKISSYGPIEHADDEAIFKMIVDPTCTAWQRSLHGAKMGNSKDLQCIKKRCVRVKKSVEDHEILPKKEMVELAGPMEEESEEK